MFSAQYNKKRSFYSFIFYFSKFDKKALLFISFFSILSLCLLAFDKVSATSHIHTRLVPFGDILVEPDSRNRFLLLKNTYTSNENVTSTKEV